MRIAILLFPRLTALDAVGPYEVLSRMPGAEVVFVAREPGLQRTDAGLALVADAGFADVPQADVLLVPGGPGQVEAMHDAELLDWLRAVDGTSTWTTAVCTGSLLLGAAGLLSGRRATSHWLALEQLADLGAVAVEERVVVDGKVVTAAGVSAGIDMALLLAGLITDDTVAQAIQLSIEYDPQPPYDAGSTRTAPPEVVELLRSLSARTRR
jgi:transcriptional regulator GlxA family with amidase domain